MKQYRGETITSGKMDIGRSFFELNRKKNVSVLRKIHMQATCRHEYYITRCSVCDKILGCDTQQLHLHPDENIINKKDYLYADKKVKLVKIRQGSSYKIENKYVGKKVLVLYGQLEAISDDSCIKFNLNEYKVIENNYLNVVAEKDSLMLIKI